MFWSVFFNKIVKFTFANVWSGISVRLRPREAVSLVLFDPFCTMEEHNNIIVLHLIHAAACCHWEWMRRHRLRADFCRAWRTSGRIPSLCPTESSSSISTSQRVEGQQGVHYSLKKTLFRGIPLVLLLYFISYWWYTPAMGWKSLKMKNSICLLPFLWILLYLCIIMFF